MPRPASTLNQGQRVVTGQRIMQGEHDMFLGWTQEHGSDQYCYVRQLKDSRLAAIGDGIADAALPYYAALCGMTLARAHARSGDAARIAGYMGSGGAFDTAIADFAMAYAARWKATGGCSSRRSRPASSRRAANDHARRCWMKRQRCWMPAARSA